MIFWDSIKNTEPTDALKYFASYWDYYCFSIKNPDVYTYVMTPHYLIKEIINEIKTNGDKNSENYNFFVNQMEVFLKMKDLFSNEIYSLWNILYEKLKSQNKDLLIILHLAESISNKFYSKDYQNMIFNRLYTEINKQDFDKDLLKTLTEIFIFEFLFNGFSLKYTEKLVKNIFSDYFIQEIDTRKHFYTTYPLKLKNNYDDYSEYIKKASEEMDNLNTEKRINRLLEILQSPKDTYYFIFYIEGFCFDEKLDFDDIVFYNPQKESMVSDSFDVEKDIFHKVNYEIGMNAIVSVNCCDIEAGKSIALKRIEQICDVFRLFENSKVNFFINDSYYKVLDCNKKMYMGSIGFAKEVVRKFDVANDAKKLPNINDFSKMLFVESNISNAEL